MGVSGITFPDSTLQITAFTGTGSGTTLVGAKIFTASGTFTIPTGVTQALVTVVGGGGAGYNGTPGDVGGGGGGGGGTIQGYITGLTPGGTVTVTVGGSAGSSSFGSYLTATAGSTGSGNYGGGGGSSSASGATIVYQATGYTGSNGSQYTCCGAGYPLGGSGGGSGAYLGMSAYNFSPRGSGGNGASFAVAAASGSAGLIIINW